MKWLFSSIPWWCGFFFKFSAAAGSSNSDLASLFECPVCFDYALPPITQCQSGHIVCQACKQKLNMCPTCRGPLGEYSYIYWSVSGHILLEACKQKVTCAPHVEDLWVSTAISIDVWVDTSCRRFCGVNTYTCNRESEGLVISFCEGFFVGNIRNLAMEKVATTVMFPCKYSSSGCPVTLLHTEKQEHEETCEYRYTNPHNLWWIQVYKPST